VGEDRDVVSCGQEAVVAYRVRAPSKACWLRLLPAIRSNTSELLDARMPVGERVELHLMARCSQALS